VSTLLEIELTRLLRRVPGSCSAALVDWEGETVVLAEAGMSGDRPAGWPEIRLIGAHLAALLPPLQESLGRLGLGAADEIRFAQGELELLLRPLRAGYFLVLALARGSGHGCARAAFELRQAAAILDAEI
jgi:hypothetical protein